MYLVSFALGVDPVSHRDTIVRRGFKTVVTHVFLGGLSEGGRGRGRGQGLGVGVGVRGRGQG